MRKSKMSRAAGMAAVLVLSLCVVGCGGTANASSDAQTVAYEQFGQKDDGTISLLVTNGLDGDITGISFRAPGTAPDVEDWTKLATASDVSLATGETAEMHVDAINASSYDLLVEYAPKGGEATVELWSVDLAGMSEITVRATSDGVGYVDYVLADGGKGSTKDAAIAIAEADRKAEEAAQAAEEQRRAEEEAALAAQAQAEAEAAAAAQAEAEAQAAAAAAAQQQSYDSYSYSGGGSSYSGGGTSYSDTGSSSAAPVTTTEDCTADVIAFD